MSTREFFETTLPAKLAANPDTAKANGATYKFTIGDDVWVVNLAECTVTEGDGDAQCSVTTDDETFNGILDKSVNAQMAFMQGKLKVPPAEIGLAMKLNTILD